MAPDDVLVTRFEDDKVRALLACLAAKAAHPQRRETHRRAPVAWPA